MKKLRLPDLKSNGISVILLLFLLVGCLFPLTAGEAEGQLIGILMHGSLSSDSRVEELLRAGADPAKALQEFLEMNYAEYILAGTYEMADNPDLVAERLISLAGGNLGGKGTSMLAAAAGNTGYYPGEQIRIIRALLKAGAENVADIEGITPQMKARVAGNTAAALFLKGREQPVPFSFNPEDTREFLPAYIQLNDDVVLPDLERTYRTILAINRGEDFPLPVNWFSSENMGADMSRLANLVILVNPDRRAHLLDLLQPFTLNISLPPQKKEMLEFFTGRLAEPEKYLFEPFPWFFFLKRTEVGLGMSMLLPAGDWQDIRQEDSPLLFDSILQADHVVRQLTIYGHPISEGYNIRRDTGIWQPSISVRIRRDGEEEPELLEVPAGIPRIMAGDVAVGDQFARKIYAQIVVSPDRGALEKGVLVRSLIQTDTDILAVTLKTYMDMDHVLHKEEYLVGESGLLIRSLLFTREYPENPALFSALDSDRRDLLEILLENGDANSLDSSGRPLIHHAAEKENSEVLSLLLSRGANPDVRDAEGRRPVSLALERQDYKSLELLLRAGAAPTYRDQKNSSPLIRAVLNGDDQAVSLLLKAGAWPDFTDQWGRSPLQWACQMGFSNIVSMLFKAHADPNLQDHFGHTPLYWAALYGWTDICAILLENGALIDAGKGDTTPLRAALSRGRQETADFLIERGARRDAL